MLIAALFAVARVQTSSSTGLPLGVDVSAYVTNASEFKFTENKGQWNPQAKFLARSPGMDMWVTNTGIAYDYQERTTDDAGKTLVKRSPVMVDFVGATGHGRAEGIHVLPGLNGYFGRKKLAGIRSFSSVAIKDLYKGIDLVTYFDKDEHRPRYDLIVHPGANADQIKMRYRGAKDLTVDKDGELKYTVNDHVKVAEERQMAYQKNGAGPDFRFLPRQVLNADKTVSFDVTGYKRDRTLVIDPLVYSTFVGGSNALGDEVVAVTVDNSGNLYVAGNSTSSDFPDVTPAQPAGVPSAFMQRYDSNHNFVVAIGSGITEPFTASAVGFDSSGLGYLCGDSTANLSDSNSVTNASGHRCIWVASIDASANVPVFSIIRSDASSESFNPAMSVSSAGIITVAGIGSFPFACQVFTDGTVHSLTRIFKGSATAINGVALSSSEIFVAGTSTDTTLTGYSGAQTSNGNNGSDHPYANVFVSKTALGGAAPDQETFVGGIGAASATGLVLDSVGNPLVSGNLLASTSHQTLGGAPEAYTFPTTGGAYDTSAVGSNDVGFVAKVSSALTSIQAATLYRSTAGLHINSLLLQEGNLAIVAGQQTGTIPLTWNYFSGHETQGFIAQLSSSLSTLGYSTYTPGDGTSFVNGVAKDSSGNYVIGGSTNSSSYPVTANAHQKTYPGGGTDGFFTVINPSVTTGLNFIHTDRGAAPSLTGGTGRVLNVTVNLVEPTGSNLTLACDTPGAVTINGHADSATDTVSDASHVLTYQVTALDVATATVVHLSATSGGQTLTVPLTIKPFLKQVIVRSATVPSGGTTTAYVYPNEVPVTDQTINISATPNGAVTATSVTILGSAGGHSISGPTTTTLQTGLVTTDTTVTVLASHAGSPDSVSSAFTLEGVNVSAITCSPTTVNAGSDVQVTVTLKAAYPTDQVFTLVSSNPTLAPNVSVTVPHGAASGSATVTTNLVFGTGSTTLRFGGITSAPKISGAVTVVLAHH